MIHQNLNTDHAPTRMWLAGFPMERLVRVELVDRGDFNYNVVLTVKRNWNLDYTWQIW